MMNQEIVFTLDCQIEITYLLQGKVWIKVLNPSYLTTSTNEHNERGFLNAVYY